jgi:hypothetical protein
MGPHTAALLRKLPRHTSPGFELSQRQPVVASNDALSEEAMWLPTRSRLLDMDQGRS